MVDDFSDNKNVYDTIDEMKAELGDKLHIIYSDEYCKKSLSKALSISKEKTLEDIDALYCKPEYKERMKALIQ